MLPNVLSHAAYGALEAHIGETCAPKVVADFVDDHRQALDISVEILAPSQRKAAHGFWIRANDHHVVFANWLPLGPLIEGPSCFSDVKVFVIGAIESIHEWLQFLPL